MKWDEQSKKWLSKPSFHRSDFQIMVLLVYALVLVALYLAPLTFNCPCVMDRHSLKPRPDIIGRRGAPMVSWCPARPHCLIQLIVQIDDAAPWEELRVASAKTCQVPISCWSAGYKRASVILENFLLPQHPVLMDQMVHVYIRSLRTIVYFAQQCGVQLQRASLLLSGSVSTRADNTLSFHLTAGRANTVPDDWP